VRFLVPRDSFQGGRNSIEHEYPDASRRFVEDNGLIPSRFRITAVVHGRGATGRLRALKAALDTPGPGTLLHPYFGAQFVSVIGPYRGHREDRDSGVFVLEITFAVTGPPAFPGTVAGIAAAVSGLSAGAITSMFEAFSAVFPRPQSAFSAGVLADAVTDVADTLDGAFGAVEDVSRHADYVSTYARRLVDAPGELAPRLEAIARAPFEDPDISNERLFFSFCDLCATIGRIQDDMESIELTTRDRILRRDGLRVLTFFIRALALVSMAEAAAGRNFTTADEVVDAQDRLVGRWNDLSEVQLEGLSAQTDQIMEQVRETWAAALDVLRELRLQLPEIVPLDVGDMPSSVLAYQLYESESEFESLAEINPGTNPILYDGEVNILRG
ncbi:MAG: DNA circularization N-terminal domain-containing protein, partial [Dichotomicrobium sp.]